MYTCVYLHAYTITVYALCIIMPVYTLCTCIYMPCMCMPGVYLHIPIYIYLYMPYVCMYWIGEGCSVDKQFEDKIAANMSAN